MPIEISRLQPLLPPLIPPTYYYNGGKSVGDFEFLFLFLLSIPSFHFFSKLSPPPVMITSFLPQLLVELYTNSVYQLDTYVRAWTFRILTHELHMDLRGDFEILEKLNEFRWYFLWWEMLEKRPILCRSLPSLLTGLPNFF